MEEKPLIYTIYGNMPVEDLHQSVRWEEDENALVLTEEFHLKTTGELVRNNVHIRLKKGLDAQVEQALFGG